MRPNCSYLIGLLALSTSLAGAARPPLPLDLPGLRSSPRLTVAAKLGDVKEVEALLKAGADPNVDDPSGSEGRPLRAAVEYDHRDVAELLIAHGAQVNDERLPPLVGEAHTKDMAEFLISHGALVDYKGLHGAGLFATACNYNRVEVVEVLFSHGASIEPGECILCSCVRTSSVKMTELLIAHGAGLNAPLGSLDSAIEAFRSDQVQALVEHGADVNVKIRGKTPLQVAIERSRQISESCRKGLILEARCSDLKNRLQEIERFLLAHGAQ